MVLGAYILYIVRVKYVKYLQFTLKVSVLEGFAECFALLCTFIPRPSKILNIEQSSKIDFASSIGQSTTYSHGNPCACVCVAIQIVCLTSVLALGFSRTVRHVQHSTQHTSQPV